jgi:hypothetical protein
MPLLPAHQQQQQVPGAAMLQQQLSSGMMQQHPPQQLQQRLQALPAGYGGGGQQGSGPMLLVHGSSLAMQNSLPMMSSDVGPLGMHGVQQQQAHMPMQPQQLQYAPQPQPGSFSFQQQTSPVLYFQPGPPAHPQQQVLPPQGPSSVGGGSYVGVLQDGGAGVMLQPLQQQQQPGVYINVQQPINGALVQEQQQQNPYQGYVAQQVPVYPQQQQQQGFVQHHPQQQLAGFTSVGDEYDIMML